MKCPFKKKTIHHERYSYYCAYDVEDFAKCDYNNCPFYDSKKGCQRVHAEISVLESMKEGKNND